MATSDCGLCPKADKRKGVFYSESKNGSVLGSEGKKMNCDQNKTQETSVMDMHLSRSYSIDCHGNVDLGFSVILTGRAD